MRNHSGSFVGAWALVACLASALAVAGPLGAAGDLYLTSPSGVVAQYDGTTLGYVGPFASGNGLVGPVGLVFRPNQNLLAYDGGADIREFDGTGNFVGVFASANGRDLSYGTGDDLFVATAAGGVARFDGLTGAPMGSFTSGYSFTSAEGLGFGGPSGNLFVVDRIGTSAASRVVEFNGTTGAYIRTLANNLIYPFDLGVGPNGNVFVTQTDLFGAPSDVVELDSTSGAVVHSYSTGGFAIGVAFHPVTQHLFVSLRNNDAFAEFDTLSGSLLNTYGTAGIQPNKLEFKVPEPATLALVLVAGLLLRRR